MAKRAASRAEKSAVEVVAEPSSGTNELDLERERRRRALNRLWGIGWDGDLEAMRLGLEDHSGS